MSYKAKDGTPYTNAPMARMHDKRSEMHKGDIKTNPKTKSHEPPPNALGASTGERSTEAGMGTVTCPHCGGDVDISGNNGTSPSMAPGSDGADDSGF